MKIREQIKDWKNIHAERVTVEKIKKKKKKKREKRTRKCGRKKKKKMKKKKRWTIRTLFIFISVTFEFGTDAYFLYYFVEIVLLKILLLSST